MKDRDARLPAVGATLTRTYKGMEIVIRFTDDGVEWLGAGDPMKFKSLSALARQVTGAKSINGFLWAGLAAPDAATEAPTVVVPPVETKAAPVSEKIGGETNEIGTLAGQRAALKAAGITK